MNKYRATILASAKQLLSSIGSRKPTLSERHKLSHWLLELEAELDFLARLKTRLESDWKNVMDAEVLKKIGKMIHDIESAGMQDLVKTINQIRKKL